MNKLIDIGKDDGFMVIRASDIDHNTAKIRVNAVGMSFGRKRHLGGKYDVGDIIDLKGLRLDHESLEEWLASGVISLVEGLKDPEDETEDDGSIELPQSPKDPRGEFDNAQEMWLHYKKTAHTSICPITGKKWNSRQKKQMWDSYDDMEFN